MSHKVNRTRIHLILFSPLAVGDGQGWQNPISCDDIPAVEDIVAREGSVGRVFNGSQQMLFRRETLSLQSRLFPHRAEDCAYWFSSQG